ncbi:peptidylprolyl isomerase [Rhodoferax aquaticus]|uniref:Chaperone SurA n=1 Tax=Rhodoferax aquaticus TaxID=2527691 RepID=A0A515EUC1_9BURK|nr:peptidylprolyl isomerase [Rhodoferax aquaticus]QDL56272.1 molecular chaperone SurA [Rhodoferax aquaticus]
MTQSLRSRALALAFSVALLAPVAMAQTAPTGDFIVALVNSEPITNAELRAEVQRVTEQLRAQRQALPPPTELNALVLERLVNDRAQLQLARETGIRVDAGAVDNAEQAVARQYQISLDELHKRLAKEGLSVAAFREQLRNQQTLTRLHERDVERRIVVTEQDIDQYLADPKNANTDPLAIEINLAQILIAVPEKASPERVAALGQVAQKTLDRLLSGEDFVKLMQEVSAGDAKNGGQLGLRRSDRYPQSFVAATQKLPVGGYSEIIRSAAGFHILQLVERRIPTASEQTMVVTRASHILLRPTPQEPEAAAVSKLKDFKRRIVAGSVTFASLAREYSQDASAAAGGDLGWANPGMFVPEFEDAMNRLAEDDISEPVVSRFGVHLIKVTERRRVALSPKEVRDSVRNQLKGMRYDDAFVNWARDVRSRAFVELRDAPQ